MTYVDRATRCVLGWRVVYERTGAVLQTLLIETVQGQRYYSDLFEAYQTVVYWPAEHTPMSDKSQTYSVEGDNAELRHYLARLGRRSRCFSRCAHALRRAVQLFCYAWNRRQLFKQHFPQYQAHLIDFVYP